jgi:hypothetical protein
VRQRKRGMVDGLKAVNLEQDEASGAELLMGSARVVAPKRVEVVLNKGEIWVRRWSEHKYALQNTNVCNDVSALTNLAPLPKL